MKPWYKSKTIWLNIFSLLVEIAQYLLDAQVIPSGTMLVIINILNIIARFITRQPIGNDEITYKY